jgi:hypothetical protein
MIQEYEFLNKEYNITNLKRAADMLLYSNNTQFNKKQKQDIEDGLTIYGSIILDLIKKENQVEEDSSSDENSIYIKKLLQIAPIDKYIVIYNANMIKKTNIYKSNVKIANPKNIIKEYNIYSNNNFLICEDTFYNSIYGKKIFYNRDSIINFILEYYNISKYITLGDLISNNGYKLKKNKNPNTKLYGFNKKKLVITLDTNFKLIFITHEKNMDENSNIDINNLKHNMIENIKYYSVEDLEDIKINLKSFYDDSKSNQIQLNGIKYIRKSMNEKMILQMILENLVNDK